MLCAVGILRILQGVFISIFEYIVFLFVLAGTMEMKTQE